MYYSENETLEQIRFGQKLDLDEHQVWVKIKSM